MQNKITQQVMSTLRNQLGRLLGPVLVSKFKLTMLKNPVLRRLSKTQYFGLNNIDKTLAEILDFEDGFYIELGANDGVAQSNTLFFEYYKNWKGILIEPHPSTYQQLTHNRASTNKFWNVACVGFDFANQTIDLAFSNLMTSAVEGRNQITKPSVHAKVGERFWRGNSYIFTARAMTLNQILQESGAPKTIDLISIDVEGAEIEVLSGIDFSNYTFKYVCIETLDFYTVNSFLEQKSYQLIKQISIHDFLFKSIVQSTKSL